MPLASLGDVKAYARIAAATDDALLTRLLDAVGGAAETYCGRSFAVQSYTDSFRPAGQSAIFLRHGPVQSFTSLMIDGAIADPSRYVRNGRVVSLLGGIFGAGAVVASYTAGYPSVPADVQQAVIETVVLRYREMTRIGEASKAIGGETVSFITSEFTPSARAILGRYREVAL